MVDAAGNQVGRVDAVELVTPGQRRGLGTGGGARRYAISVDTTARTVVVGEAADLHVRSVELAQVGWVHQPVLGEVEAQTSAHGAAVEASFDGDTVRFARPQRRVAPGQSVVLYRGDEVVGGGIASA